MDAITREVFTRWAQKNNWMQIGEAATPNGFQYSFLTPSGAVVVVMYDLKGNLLAFGQPAPISQSPLASSLLKK